MHCFGFLPRRGATGVRRGKGIVSITRRPIQPIMAWHEDCTRPEGTTNRKSDGNGGFCGQMIRRDSEIQDVNFVVGRIDEYWLGNKDGEMIQTIQKKLGDEHLNCTWVDINDLNRGGTPRGER